MAELYRRGRIWWVTYYASGTRVQETTRATNKREAEKFLALRVSEVERNVYVKPVHATLGELWERYLANAKLRKRSWKRDVQMYGHLERFFGSVKLASIGPLGVEKYQQSRIREVAPATVNRETGLLKHMFSMAERWQMHSGSNPVKLVKFLPEDNLQFQTVSEEDEQKLLAAAPPYLRELILFLLNSGLRCGDLFKLTWQEVDLEQRRIKFIMEKTRRGLEVPLNDTAYEILVARRAVRHGEYVFYNVATGDRFKDVKLGLKSTLKRAGLSGITFHTFRHTFASRLTRSGVDLVTVKEIMGHSTINTTMRYAHSNYETKARAVAMLGRGDKVVTVVPRGLKKAV
jgi:integrase